MITSFYYTTDGKLQVLEGVQDFDRLMAAEGSVLWVDLCKPTDDESYILTHDFEFHPLAIEDVISERSRTKLDNYDRYLFVVFPVVDFIGREEGLKVSELDFFLTANALVTVRYDEHRIFDYLHDRARRDERLIARGADYLFHTILDTVVDNYNAVLDIFEYEVDQVEEDVLGEADEDTLRSIFALRRDIVQLKRIVIPQRELVAHLARQSHPLISENLRVYFSDILDHLSRVNDLADDHRELLNSSLEVYYSTISTKTNEIIKFLTLLSAIFIPPTFLVGLWGMNFHNMPELDWAYGYPLALAFMLTVMVGMILFFRRRGWF